jgi:hypothetical protein
MASSGASRERSVVTDRTFAGRVVARVKGGNGPGTVAEDWGARLGTILCWASSYEGSIVVRRCHRMKKSSALRIINLSFEGPIARRNLEHLDHIPKHQSPTYFTDICIYKGSFPKFSDGSFSFGSLCVYRLAAKLSASFTFFSCVSPLSSVW